MKVKVIKRYVDRHTKEIMEVGMTKNYPKNQAKELMGARYTEPVSEKTAYFNPRTRVGCDYNI